MMACNGLMPSPASWFTILFAMISIATVESKSAILLNMFQHSLCLIHALGFNSYNKTSNWDLEIQRFQKKF